MITLKTLPDATAQEVYDHIARHLLTQKKMSTNSKGDCVYHSPDGLQCAAGCLIAPDEYNPKWENETWPALQRTGRVPATHANLIDDLQMLHDGGAPETWEHSLLVMAHKYNLIPLQGNEETQHVD